MEVQKNKNVTATRASETIEPAGGSGSSHKSSSVTTVNAQMPRNTAPHGDNGTHGNTAPSEESWKRSTLAEKLLASQKSPCRSTAAPSVNAAELFKNMEALEKSESGFLNRVGRRLQTMLEATKTAKNIVKPIQLALAEAIDAYKHARMAHTEHQEARAIWLAKTREDQEDVDASPSSTPLAHGDTDNTNGSGSNSTLKSIAHELRELRKDVRDIQSAQRRNNSNEDGESWTDVVRRKPRTTKPRKDQPTTAAMDTAGPPPNIRERTKTSKTRPPAIIVRVENGKYCEALKKLKDSEQVKAVAEDIVGLTKTRSGDLLIRLNTRFDATC